MVGPPSSGLAPAETVEAELPTGPVVEARRNDSSSMHSASICPGFQKPERERRCRKITGPIDSHGVVEAVLQSPAVQRCAASGRTPQMIPIHQVLATLGCGDVIGHEVARHSAECCGHMATTQRSSSRLQTIASNLGLETTASWWTSAVPTNCYSTTFRWAPKASRTAFALPDRMALIYHNITLPEHFIGVHKTLARQCFRGRRELRAYVDRCDLALGDSEFNRQDLEQLGFPRTAVLPVVPDFSHLDGAPNRWLARQFDDAWTNILFVGRVIANKKIEDLIRFFHAYQQFNARSRLIIVGAHTGFERYLTALNHIAASLGIDHVHFVGHVSDAELIAFYEIADLSVCERARRVLRPTGRSLLDGSTRGSPTQRPPCLRLWMGQESFIRQRTPDTLRR